MATAIEARASGLRLRGAIRRGRVETVTVDEAGAQVVGTELTDDGLLRLLVADVIDGELVQRIGAVLDTWGGERGYAPLCSVTRCPLTLSLPFVEAA